MSSRNSKSALESITEFVIVGTIGVVGFLGIVLLMAVLTALPVMWAWNAIIPTIFGLTSITFSQALWLSLLCSCLFKSSSSSSSK